MKVRELDPCCGEGREWGDIRSQDCIRGDQLLTLKPTLCLDFKLLPFRDACFDVIYFDPPHLIRNDVKHFNPSYLKFGNWKSRAEWEEALTAVNIEFHRVGKKDATLFVKIIHGKDRRVTKRDDLKLLTKWKLVAMDERPSAVG